MNDIVYCGSIYRELRLCAAIFVGLSAWICINAQRELGYCGPYDVVRFGAIYFFFYAIHFVLLERSITISQSRIAIKRIWGGVTYIALDDILDVRTTSVLSFCQVVIFVRNGDRFEIMERPGFNQNDGIDIKNRLLEIMDKASSPDEAAPQ